jgi:hypothetical protein
MSLNSPVTPVSRLSLAVWGSGKRLTGEFGLMAFTNAAPVRLTRSLTRCGDGLLLPITVFGYVIVRDILAMPSIMSRVDYRPDATIDDRAAWQHFPYPSTCVEGKGNTPIKR